MPNANGHKVVMVFPGQGSQWLGMGRELFLREPVFREMLEACDHAFKPYSGWSLIQELHASLETSRLQEIDVIQPALCAIQIALAKLWLSWGIKPDAITGHSMGEVAAACIAGALTLSQAARIICTRSALMKKVSGKGSGMLVTELPPAAAERLISEKYPALCVAVNNSPKFTVLAGDLQVIDELRSVLDSQGVFCRPVKVDVASHSRQMDPLLADLREALNDISPQPNHIPLFSTARNKMINGAELDAAYWTDNLRNTVQFSAAMEYLMQEGHTVFIEVSPHPVLLNAINECAGHFKAKVIPVATTYREKPELDSVYRSLGELYEQGYDIDWEQFYQTTQAPDVMLPGYPFQREPLGITDKPEPVKEEQVFQEEEDLLHRFQAPVCPEERKSMLQQLLARHIAFITKMPQGRIKPSMTFKGLGIDSLMAVQLKNRLEESLRLKLSVATFWAYPCLSEYVSLLTSMLEDHFPTNVTGTLTPLTNIDANSAAGWLVIPRRHATARYRLFCFHDAGGDTSLFSGWERRLGDDFEVAALELPGRGKRWKDAHASDIPALISDMLPALAPLLDKPFLFFGHSLGGLLAFETARMMHRAQLPLPQKLFISAMPAPSDYPVKEVEHTFSEAQLTRIFPHLDRNRLGDEELFQLLIKRLRADLRLLNNYTYMPGMPLPLPLVIIHGEDDKRVNAESVAGWHGETSVSAKIILRPGGHRYIEHDLDFLSTMIRKETGEQITEHSPSTINL